MKRTITAILLVFLMGFMMPVNAAEGQEEDRQIEKSDKETKAEEVAEKADSAKSEDTDQETEDTDKADPEEDEEDIVLYSYFTDDLPKIYIKTKDGIAIFDKSLINPDEVKGMDGEIPVYNYVEAQISVTDCEGYEMTDVPAQVKVRGNYTSIYQKKPIRIKFDKKQAMCGLNDGAELKSWVLLAEFLDSSLLRNSVAQYIANSLYSSSGYYATDFRYVEVYLNDRYNGIYLLVEQQQAGTDRVNIPQPEDPEDYDLDNLSQEEYEELHNVRTGYFFEYDGYSFNEPENVQFAIRYDPLVNDSGTEWTPKSMADEGIDPKEDPRPTGFSITSDIYFDEQRDYLEKCVQSIWDVIYDAAYNDHENLEEHPYHTMTLDGEYEEDPSIESAMEAVSKVVDIDSLVDMYLLQEVTQNADCRWSSFYFTLDMSEEGNHLLTYTAPWDFDQSFGKEFRARSVDSLFLMEDIPGNPWFAVFLNQEWFWKAVYERYTEAEEAGVFSGALEMIDTYTDIYQEDFDENYDRWASYFDNMPDLTMINQEEASDSIRDMLVQKLEYFGPLLRQHAGIDPVPEDSADQGDEESAEEVKAEDAEESKTEDAEESKTEGAEESKPEAVEESKTEG